MSARTRPLLSVGLLLTVAAAGPARAQCPDGTMPPCGPRPGPPSPRSIAVLPFASRSPDTADVYLAEGLTDEVSSHLTQMSRLQVKARSLVRAQWRRTPDPFDAARRLNVAWFVHGTVRHVAPQLLVSVELVRPATGEQVWAKRFARPDGDLFAAQAEVAESVAVVVGGRLRPSERAVLVRRPTRNNEAYRLYLFGNSLFGRLTQVEMRRAVDAYAEAVQLDPRFAAAWGRLSLARGLQYELGWEDGVPRDSVLALSVAAARRAVSLDTLSSDAWLAQGAAGGRTGGDLGAVQMSYERLLRLDSLNPETFGALAASYGPGVLDIHGVAAPLLRRALALDPSARLSWRQLAWVTLNVGRVAEAEALLDTALAFGPWSLGFGLRWYVRFLRGNAVGALADIGEVERLTGVPSRANRALVALLVGDSAPAREILRRLRAQADSG